MLVKVPKVGKKLAKVGKSWQQLLEAGIKIGNSSIKVGKSW